MINIGVIGLNHKTASLEVREALCNAARNVQQLTLFQEKMKLCKISTCNRTEIYFSSKNLSDDHHTLLSLLRRQVNLDFQQSLYTFFGRDCLSHLTYVICGLDSMKEGETEIQGQVKRAYAQAHAAQTLNTDLHFAFQKALRLGKLVRSNFNLGSCIPLERSITTSLISHANKQSSILFVGASHTNQRIIRHLASIGYENLYLVNRTLKHKNIQARVLPWTALRSWSDFNVVICATTSPEPLIHLEDANTGKQLLIDLSVPRNIDPRLASIEGKTLYNIDTLYQSLASQNCEKAEPQYRRIDPYIQEKISRYIRSFSDSRAPKSPAHLHSIAG